MKLAVDELQHQTTAPRQPRCGFLVDCDLYVLNWVIETFDVFYTVQWNGERFIRTPMAINKAVGIIDNQNRQLIGGAIFDQFNSYNVELSYYGPNTLTPGIIRSLAWIALNSFNPTRVSMRTSVNNTDIIRGLKKLGFMQESIERDCFGRGKDAARLVIFRDQIERLYSRYRNKLN